MIKQSREALIEDLKEQVRHCYTDWETVAHRLCREAPKTKLVKVLRMGKAGWKRDEAPSEDLA